MPFATGTPKSGPGPAADPLRALLFLEAVTSACLPPIEIEAYNARAADIYTEQAKDVDIIITTALIAGRPAPKLLTAEDVAAMKSGSVIVDMAAGQGGNVEGSVARARIADNGVVILGYTDLSARLPTQASQLYGTNLLKLLAQDKDGVLRINFEDVVQRSVTVVRDGERSWPPPVQVPAAHTVKSDAATTAGSTAPKKMQGLSAAGVSFQQLVGARA